MSKVVVVISPYDHRRGDIEDAILAKYEGVDTVEFQDTPAQTVGRLRIVGTALIAGDMHAFEDVTDTARLLAGPSPEIIIEVKEEQ